MTIENSSPSPLAPKAVVGAIGVLLFLALGVLIFSEVIAAPGALLAAFVDATRPAKQEADRRDVHQPDGRRDRRPTETDKPPAPVHEQVDLEKSITNAKSSPAYQQKIAHDNVLRLLIEIRDRDAALLRRIKSLRDSGDKFVASLAAGDPDKIAWADLRAYAGVNQRLLDNAEQSVRQMQAPTAEQLEPSRSWAQEQIDQVQAAERILERLEKSMQPPRTSKP